MEQIPLDIIKTIILYLDLSDINKVSQINRKFQQICHDNYIWMQKCLDLGIINSEINALSIYKRRYQLKRSTVPLDVFLYGVYFLDMSQGKYILMASYLVKDENEIWDTLLYIYQTNTNGKIFTIIDHFIQYIEQSINKNIKISLKYRNRAQTKEDKDFWNENLKENKSLLIKIMDKKNITLDFLKNIIEKFFRFELIPLHKTYTNPIYL